jgi:hypothetical protein
MMGLKCVREVIPAAGMPRGEFLVTIHSSALSQRQWFLISD